MTTCIVSPGHNEAAITFHDAYTELMLTADTVYPGRLYVQDWPAFRATIDSADRVRGDPSGESCVGLPHRDDHDAWSRLPIRTLTVSSPDEPPLEMTVDQLREIRRAIGEIGDQPGRYVYPEFVIYYRGS